MHYRVAQSLPQSWCERGCLLAAASQVNLHEVALVREIVRYLLRQGYQTGQLVVLTPYLGQLLELQKELSRDMQVRVRVRVKGAGSRVRVEGAGRGCGSRVRVEGAGRGCG